MKNFIEELRWRGMIQDIMPETEQHLMEGLRAAYVGIDPTADSLHIGHLVGVMMLRHFQNCGHKPYALVGGATGMIGDPSGKSVERNLLTEEVLAHNIAGIKKQLAKFISTVNGGQGAVREAVEYILKNQGLWETVVADYAREAHAHGQ